MGGPALATTHHWMRVPMTEFPDTTNFAACGGYRAEIGFCRFLWLRNSGWPRQAFSPFFTALAASRPDGASVARHAARLKQARHLNSGPLAAAPRRNAALLQAAMARIDSHPAD